MTPSEIDINGNGDVLRSPLAKRKKLAAGRVGSSMLKVSISANDLVIPVKPLPPAGENLQEDADEDRDEDEGADGDDDGDDDVTDGDLDDDFLAGALEEDWG